MKFITSTHLKQWAGSKDCQQMLPELIKKLINASVSKLDRLTFPSGDATFLPGWDGIVSCDEQIDLVPAGVSLWECGANDAVKSKIDSDYEKRSKDSLGYDKTISTFVFVTPRLWEGSEEWLKSHQGEWKNIVIYTAVELEDWIEKHPSVGMWLAQKMGVLSTTDYTLPEKYWETWALGKEYSLPYDIILPGREEESKQVINASLGSGSLVIQTLSQDEGIAFSIASILTCSQADVLKDRLIVVTDKKAFDELVEQYNNLIILTTVTEGINYATNRGHAVIVASTPADQIKQVVVLPTIEKEGFVKALVKIGNDEAKARIIAKDTARDINVLRRREGIIIDKPKWMESIDVLLPAFLVGKWIDDVEGDCVILEELSGMKYEQFEAKLYQHLLEEDTPLIHIGKLWRIRSPYEAVGYIQNILTPSILNKVREMCLQLIQDDDPEAAEILKPDFFPFKQCQQKYSSAIKEGVYQNLCLFSIIDNSGKGEFRSWVDETLKEMLKDWNMSRFLSNRRYFTALAEASPDCFLVFLENLSDEILDAVFKPIKQKYSICGWSNCYTEVLFALEMLAWDKQYLNRVTKLLLRSAELKNESNYANNPEQTLFQIYRFLFPQTYASFDDRMSILSLHSSEYANTVYKICKKNCEIFNGRAFETNAHFRWRMFGQLKSIDKVYLPTVKQLNENVTLMLKCCDYSSESVIGLIALSADANMSSVRQLIFSAIREHLSGLEDVRIVSDGLRKTITRHVTYADSNWALSEADLLPYQQLLDEIEPKDLMNKNAWLFEYPYVELQGKKGVKYEVKYRELLAARTEALQEIADSYGQDSIWAFIKMVKCPESLSGSIVAIYNDKLFGEVCDKYKTKEITEGFVKSYFSALYYSNTAHYLGLAKKVVGADGDLTIVLYAPGYVEELAHLASSCGENIKRNYWELVSVGFNVLNAESVIQELLAVNRCSEAIELLCTQDKLQMSDLEIVKVICSYLTNSVSTRSQMDMHYIETLLNRLDNSEDPEVIQILLLVEFLLFRVLDHEMNMSKTRFVKELSKDPELMIQIAELAYASNKGEDEKEGVAIENMKAMKECAFYILFWGRNLVSFIDNEGKLDESRMVQYIEKLYELAKDRVEVDNINCVVGDILGDIPRDENYPPIALCDMVEHLNSDTVDRHINMRIVNSRGMTFRSPKEHGEQELAIVATFKKYKERTELLYPRMAAIFNDLIKEYSDEARRIDVEASIDDLEY